MLVQVIQAQAGTNSKTKLITIKEAKCRLKATTEESQERCSDPFPVLHWSTDKKAFPDASIACKGLYK